jgi:hypothetical protein
MKETLKTIVLTALVAGIISFVAGVHYQGNVSKQLEASVLTHSVDTASLTHGR